ncbi:C-terminal processing peptidase-3. Serine peptidase. MEROPS family S41A [Reichenbachiella faecimaris]|uniref:C-terminal processing peptidase-3. Serine peptidase. MEROPS family S41A n=1 Tax=Reichenbachiella faecimaris TaxID=692418 RepID=A0A1W2GAV2_REIFA|nr:S41 family peptidase [Reichenbachiella faecimaris]SMD33787.1 C-terminal processing peptidase-3. Serine peptidase. MEROPS family S41A [Reichenbachiella faecimaris]
MKRIVIGVVGVALLAGLFSFTWLGGDHSFEISRNLNIFTTLYRELNTHYVDEVSSEKLIGDGIEAMLKSLDPYAAYISENDIEDYRTATTGEYGGIGAIVGQRNRANTVIMPYVGYPAHTAGLKIGDEILEIDHQNLENKTSTEISELLKGQPGSEIVLRVKRYGRDKPFDVTLTRSKITIDNVMFYGMYNETIGFIKLTDFTTDAGSEVKNALDSLKSAGATKIILDLRDNPGGLLDEAVKVANVFVEQGKEVVSTKGKMASWNKTYTTPYASADNDIPLVVLTSRATASAAEIVSGVVQDYDRGVLVGTRTFGKGLVQATRPLPYNSQLKITTAKYYIPSGRCIQAIDYSHRNEDGSVGKIPDSLKVAFKTSKGRTVYDGGGIEPDIPVTPQKFSNLLYNMVSQNLIFDYANEYAFNHPEIPAPRQFELTDAEYIEFVTWVKGKEFNLSSQMDDAIKALEEMAKKEKYYEGMEPTIEKLKAKVSTLKENYLETFKDDIKFMLEEEIVSRYYFHTGMMEASLDHDPAVLEAAKILADTQTYSKILNQ